MTTQHKRVLGVLTVLGVDAAVAVGGFHAGSLLHAATYTLHREAITTLGSYGMLRFSLLVLLLAIAAVVGLYRAPHRRSIGEQTAMLLRVLGAAVALLVLACFVLNLALPPRWLLGSVAVVTATGLLVVRLGTSTVLRVLWRRGIGVERVLVVGDGIVARAVMQDLIRNGARRGQQLHGCVVDHAPAKGALLLDAGRAVRVPIRGSTHNLDAVLATEQVQHVLVALSAADTSTMQQILSAALRHNVDVHVAPETLGIAAQRITADRRHNQPVLTIQDMAQRQHHRALKRALDICLSLLVLVPWGLLVTAVVAVLIKIDSRGPVFFRQQRLTRTGKPFWVFKFRTMVVNADELKAQLMAHNEASGPIFKMRDDPRLTRVGRWLRRTSLDEVPQVFNILRGDMSWVGPRPPLPAEVDQYEAWQRRRLDITTGLTGLSQISGRSLLAFDDTAKLDLYYIENWSISLDLQILLRTIPAVLTGRGAC